jgi:hypothetical protein
MSSVKFFFDKPRQLVEPILRHPHLLVLFKHWNTLPTFTASEEDEGECSVTIMHDDTEGMHEAADIAEAFLTGVFAAHDKLMSLRGGKPLPDYPVSNL